MYGHQPTAHLGLPLLLSLPLLQQLLQGEGLPLGRLAAAGWGGQGSLFLLLGAGCAAWVIGTLCTLGAFGAFVPVVVAPAVAVVAPVFISVVVSTAAVVLSMVSCVSMFAAVVPAVSITPVVAVPAISVPERALHRLNSKLNVRKLLQRVYWYQCGVLQLVPLAPVRMSGFSIGAAACRAPGALCRWAVASAVSFPAFRAPTLPTLVPGGGSCHQKPLLSSTLVVRWHAGGCQIMHCWCTCLLALVCVTQTLTKH